MDQARLLVARDGRLSEEWLPACFAGRFPSAGPARFCEMPRLPGREPAIAATMAGYHLGLRILESPQKSPAPQPGARQLMTTPPPLISLVIPAWNEQSLLPRLLESVAVARRNFEAVRQGSAVEIIVADNGSSDATAAIARTGGCKVVRVDKRVIGAARNGGAAAAGGAIIAFVDADSVLHPECFSAIAAAMASPRTGGGSTGVRMERMSAGIALTLAVALPAVWLTRMDTGTVFCRREDFRALGGFDERRLAAEDIHFQWRLRRLLRARGEHLRRLTHVKTMTSTRKFDQYGDWHYFLRMPAFAWKLLRNPSAFSEFAKRYWYDGR